MSQWHEQYIFPFSARGHKLELLQLRNASSEASELKFTSFATMADIDMLEAMGITGFGKVTKKRQLDPGRFDKNKRAVEVRSSASSHADHSA